MSFKTRQGLAGHKKIHKEKNSGKKIGKQEKKRKDTKKLITKETKTEKLNCFSAEDSDVIIYR